MWLMPVIPKNPHTKYGLKQLKTKELQTKMYLTETHRLIGFIKEAIGSLCGGTWTTFQVEKKSIPAIKSPW